MEKTFKFVRILFAVPWIIFGIQHFIYADFVATLVPWFVPLKLFWAYFTGAAMCAAGISLTVNRFARLAAILLGVMLMIFILLIHVPALIVNPFSVAALTRPLQDVSLACAAFLLAQFFARQQIKPSSFKLTATISRCVFAVMLIGFGVQQFFDLNFLTAKIPLYFPFRLFWVYLTGAAMIAAGTLVIVNIKPPLAATALGIFLLLINLLNYVFLLANDLHNPVLWTAAMLNLAITAGVFILAISLRRESVKLTDHSAL